ncbi:MAG: NTP transferase domain-containing protein [Candidatus Kerfeldbacteria bacterium]|nr:NTP transferase domain-containing protein [Candidatus Kerfeldbacteria bacterium]
MKGIILAGGAGTRLKPLTLVTSKQLLPVYNRPMIFYPLETLIQAGIKDILIIVAPDRAGDFLRVLGSGKEFNAKFTYEIQERPEGLAQAFIIGETFIGRDSVSMILGDNIFFDDRQQIRQGVKSFKRGARVYAKKVSDPERYGVVEFTKNMRAKGIVEKPKVPRSTYAVTGLYTYDNRVVELTKSLKPSPRGELEITDLNNIYLHRRLLDVKIFEGEWLDTGTFDSLLLANTVAAERLRGKTIAV